MRVLLTTLLSLAWLAVNAHTDARQAEPQATEVLVGRVISDLDVPIAGASIRVLAAGREPAAQVRTDAAGRFAVANVRRPVTIAIQADGFVPLSRSLVQPRDGYRGLAAAAQNPISIRLERFAEISGMVRYQDGAPMAGALIEVYKRAQLGTRRIWTSTREPVMAGPDGRFVARSLSPGEFVLSVPILATTLPRTVMDLTRRTPAGADASAVVALESSRAPGPPGPPPSGAELASWVTNVSSRRLPPVPTSDAGRTFRTTYFPGVPTLNDAGIVTLTSGEKRDHVDVTMQTAMVSTVTGVLMDGAAPAAFTGVRLISAEADETSIDLDAQAAVTASDRSGAFTFLNVPQGRYLLKATVLSGPEDGNGPILPRASELRRWTDVPVVVDRRVVNLGPVPLYEPVAVHGRIVLDDRSLPAEGATLDINVWASGVVSVGPPSLVHPAADGTFELRGLVKGRYELVPSVRIPSPPEGAGSSYRVRTIVADGRDITRTPLVVGVHDLTVTITFTRQDGGVFGTARLDDVDPAPNAQVVVVPQNLRQWMTDGMPSRVLARVDANDKGGYAVRGLPSGVYVAAALSAEQLALWPDPRVVDAIARVGIPVRIEDGQWATLDMVVRSSLPIAP